MPSYSQEKSIITPTMNLTDITTQVDVLVVGSGFAGLAAAIEARIAGVSVMIIEKKESCGGNSVISGGALAAIHPERQGRKGIEDSPQKMCADMLKSGRHKNNPDLVRLVAEKSYETMCWLTDEIGIQFMDRVDQFGGHSVPRCYTEVNNSGNAIIQALLLKAIGLGVKVKSQTSMQSLCKNPQGKVEGVRVFHSIQNGHKEGATVTKYIKVNKSIILASGGFCGDTAFKTSRNITYSDNLDRTTLSGTTAEVLVEAERVGAKSVVMSQLQFLPGASPDEKGRGSAPFFATYVVNPFGFMVSPKNGKRFVNEWTDRKTRAEKMLAIGEPCIGIVDEKGVKNSGKMINKFIDPAIIKQFSDYQALADFYHIPSFSLRESLDEYNHYVTNKKDMAYHKSIPLVAEPLSPPYYAIRLWPKAHYSMGGIAVNEKAQVLSMTDSVIDGLYAVGEVASGVHGESRLAACAITECFVFGRIAGKNAAQT